MAYEKMDKQALATMARDYDRKSKPKVGFWGGLLASLSSVESTACSSDSENGDYHISLRDTPLSPRESHYNVSHYERNSGRYSPMLGRRDD